MKLILTCITVLIYAVCLRRREWETKYYCYLKRHYWHKTKHQESNFSTNSKFWRTLDWLILNSHPSIIFNNLKKSNRKELLKTLHTTNTSLSNHVENSFVRTLFIYKVETRKRRRKTLVSLFFLDCQAEISVFCASIFIILQFDCVQWKVYFFNQDVWHHHEMTLFLRD